MHDSGIRREHRRDRIQERVRLDGRRVRLRPVQSEDYDYLYDLSLAMPNIVRWRYRGRTPSPDEFVQSLWHSVLCQFVIEARESRQPVGLVLAYSPEFQAGWCYIAIIADPRLHGKGLAIEGLVILIDYVFANWNFRKLYADSVDFNYSTFASGAGDVFEHEATLREYEYFDGELWDLHYISIRRDRWEARTVLRTGGDPRRSESVVDT